MKANFTNLETFCYASFKVVLWVIQEKFGGFAIGADENDVDIGISASIADIASFHKHLILHRFACKTIHCCQRTVIIKIKQIAYAKYMFQYALVLRTST